MELSIDHLRHSANWIGLSSDLNMFTYTCTQAVNHCIVRNILLATLSTCAMCMCRNATEYIGFAFNGHKFAFS